MFNVTNIYTSINLLLSTAFPSYYTNNVQVPVYDINEEPYVFVEQNDQLKAGRFYYTVLELPKSMLPSGSQVISTTLDDLPITNQYPRLYVGYPSIVPISQLAPEHKKRRTTTTLPGHTMLMIHALDWTPEQLISALDTKDLYFNRGRFIGGGFIIRDEFVMWDPISSVKSTGQLEGNIDPFMKVNGIIMGRSTMNPMVPRVEDISNDPDTANWHSYIPESYILPMMEAIVRRTGMPIRIETNYTRSPFEFNKEKNDVPPYINELLKNLSETSNMELYARKANRILWPIWGLGILE